MPPTASSPPASPTISNPVPVLRTTLASKVPPPRAYTPMSESVATRSCAAYQVAAATGSGSRPTSWRPAEAAGTGRTTGFMAFHAGMADQTAWVQRRCDDLLRNLEHFIHGKTHIVRDAVICLLGEGHILIEDVPGVAKTSLAKAISHSIAGSMRRIQFTPDLLASDVIGVQIYDTGKRQFQFREGPVFANIILGDEINRASPKTQSALLEVMAEHQVTVDGVTYPLPRPNFVIATQNPIDQQGT